MLGSARKPIQQPALRLAVIVAKAILDKSDDERVRDKLAVVHEVLGLLSKRRTSLHSSAQHVSSREMRNPEISDDQLALSALP